MHKQKIDSVTPRWLKYRLILCFGVLISLLSNTTAIAQTEQQAIILQYHHVSTNTPASTSLSMDSFYAHMEYLKNNNFTILPLEQVVESLQGSSTLPEKTAVITFDDGYLSVYDTAFPLLKELDWPFTIFVTTSLVGSNSKLYANWEQLNEMALAGATMANHTVTHPHLLEVLSHESNDQWLQRVKQEITQAELTIKEKTGQNHKILAYPYGEYKPEIQSLLVELGFTGVAQHSGPINNDSDFSALPRFPFSGIYASMNSFPTKVNSLAFSFTSISPESPITTESMPSARLNFKPGNYRLNLLACYNNGESIEVKQLDESEYLYLITSHINNSSRRFRYNCTAPSSSGAYYWYSLPWINPSIAE